MQSTPSMTLLAGPLSIGVLEPDIVPYMGQIELFDI